MFNGMIMTRIMMIMMRTGSIIMERNGGPTTSVPEHSKVTVAARKSSQILNTILMATPLELKMDTNA